MKLTELAEIIHCLNCGRPELELSAQSGDLVCNHCNQKYGIKNGVPVFLNEKTDKNSGETDFHKGQGTSFNYIEHYRKDGTVHDYFEERDAATEHADRRVREFIFSKIKKKSGRVLDVGCGRAWVAQELCPKNYDVVSLDISLENTAEALQKYPFGNHSAVVADVFSIPFNENTFDIIIASEIIEHVIDPALFVKNLMHILNPGGTLMVTTPYKEKIRYTLCVHCNKLTPMHAHIHSFDEKILTSLYKRQDNEPCNYFTFANKIPAFLRMHVFMKYFNFWWWKKTDQLFNLIKKAPLRILVKWEKETIQNDGM